MTGGKGDIFVHLSLITAGLSDRMAWVQHTFHFALQIFGNIFPPQHLKNYVSYMKMHVGCQVKHTLLVFVFCNNMSKTQDAGFYS